MLHMDAGTGGGLGGLQERRHIQSFAIYLRIIRTVKNQISWIEKHN